MHSQRVGHTGRRGADWFWGVCCLLNAALFSTMLLANWAHAGTGTVVVSFVFIGVSLYFAAVLLRDAITSRAQ